MEKKHIDENFALPMPVVLVGAQVGGKANFMAAGWCTRANGNPPMVLCAIGKTHHTHEGITETGTFSVNVPSTASVAKTDYCGMVSGAAADKSGIFEVFYGNLRTAPMIRECPVNLECHVVETVPLPTHTLFIGEIVAAYADENVIVGGKPDYAAIDPLLLTMPDNRYRRLGESVASAWSSGKGLVHEPK